MANIPSITPSQIAPALDYYMANFRNAYFHGAPGIGKSMITAQWCKDHAKAHGWTFVQAGGGVTIDDPDMTFGFIDLRLSTVDPLDFKGSPMLNKEEGFTEYLKSAILPDEKRHGKHGVLFLDELADAAGMTLSAASQLILDRRVGTSYVLPDGWLIIAAGNRREDNASAKRLPSQLANRFGHFNVDADVPDFTKYLASQGSDGRLAAFIRLRPELIHFRENKDQVAYPTPRAWVAVDEVLKNITDDKGFRETMIASFVGSGPASELEGFLAMASQLTSWNAIVSDPLTANLPEPGSSQSVAAMFALIGMVCNRVDNATIDQAMAYVGRMPQDFQVCFMLDLQNSKPDLMDNLSVSQWRSANNNVAI
jgi:hypothetical protein